MSDPTVSYDSRPETLKHSLRVGALMGETITELVQRSTGHDISKTEPPELEYFDRYTPRLAGSTYGSDEYKRFLQELKPALDHHYAHNPHHPEFHLAGVDGMTLVDLVEMICDWKASSERHTNGDLARSLRLNQDRFGMSDQLTKILHNTAIHFGWISADPDTEDATLRRMAEDEVRG